MPAAARAQTPEGADAFTRYYVAIYNEALRTLDSKYMRQLSNGCETCDLLADQVDDIAANGQEVTGGEVRVVGSTRPYVTGDQAQLVFDIRQAPLSLTAHGKPVDGSSFSEFSTTGGGGALRWSDDQTSWIFTQWTWPE